MTLPALFHDRLHWLALALLAPLLLASALLTAPFQVPDENNHFLRAAQLAELDFRTLEHKGEQGGLIRPGYRQIAREERFASKSFNQGMKLDGATYLEQDYWRIPAGGERGLITYPNTAYYPAANYALPALGLALNPGGAMAGFYAGRLVVALGVCLILFLALKAITRGRLFCLTLIAMPMSVSLLASYSQDAALIAYALAAAALGNRYLDRPAHGFWPLAGMALFLLPLALGRPPYAPLLLIPLLLARDVRDRRIAGALLAVSVALLAAWVQWMKGGPRLAPEGVDQAVQLQRVLEHPVATLRTLFSASVDRLPEYAQQFTGVLGWLDIVLPGYIQTGFLALLAGLLLLGRPRLNSLPHLGIVALLCSIPLLTALAQYLYWTPVGLDDVWGVQGRYYIPPALLLSLILRPASQPSRLAALPALAVLLFAAAANLDALRVVSARFWA
ncbi:MAG: DUF2142 domain-containing protein [Betaproteobacteria bacterium]|nr:DUF2142 domain-containing protein [Betaproteobacteria bacterium]